MTEVLFYHLQGQPLERVLPTLLERSLERGWRVVVQSSSEERVEALEKRLAQREAAQRVRNSLSFGSTWSGASSTSQWPEPLTIAPSTLSSTRRP